MRDRGGRSEKGMIFWVQNFEWRKVRLFLFSTWFNILTGCQVRLSGWRSFFTISPRAEIIRQVITSHHVIVVVVFIFQFHGFVSATYTTHLRQMTSHNCALSHTKMVDLLFADLSMLWFSCLSVEASYFGDFDLFQVRSSTVVVGISWACSITWQCVLSGYI